MKDPEVEEILKATRELQEPRELTPEEAEVFKAAMLRSPDEYATRYLRTQPCPTRALRAGTTQHLHIELDAVEEAMENALGRQEYDDLNTRRAELLGQIKEMEQDR